MKNNFLSAGIWGGGFVSGNSILHRMEPGRKMLLALIFICVTTQAGGAALAVPALACVAGLRLSGCSIREAVGYLRGFIWFVAIMALAPVLFTPGVQAEAFREFPVFITCEGIEKGSLLGARLMVMFFVPMVFLRTTSRKSMARCMQSFCSGRRGIPVWLRETVAVGILALQLLPVVCIRAEAWAASKLERERERLRGEGLFERIGNTVGLLGLLMIALLTDPENLMSESETVKESR